MRQLQIMKRSIGVAAAIGVLSVQQAHAALGTDVTTALETAKTDGVAIGGLVLAVIIAIAAFKYLRRAL